MRLSDAVGSEDPAVLCEKAAALVSLLQRHDRNEELGLYRETESCPRSTWRTSFESTGRLIG